MLLLVAATDRIRVITSQAGIINSHASFLEASQGTSPAVSAAGRQNGAITTATTTDVVSVPAASTTRNVKTINLRNASPTVTNDLTVIYDQNGTTFELFKATLLPGDVLEYVEGVGWFVVKAPVVTGAFTNHSVASQTGFAADTYLAGSSVPLAGLGTPTGGLTYTARLDVTKTAAGIATPIFVVRVGTAGTTADTARCTLTFGPGTAVADTAVVTVTATFRTVGAGTAAVLVGEANADCLPTTGWSSTIKAAVAVSAGFDSTAAGLIVGLSYNGGTSAAHTIQQVTAGLSQT